MRKEGEEAYCDLLVALVGIDSETFRERQAGLLLYRFLKERFPHDLLELQAVGPRRQNVLLRKGSPRTTLSSHIDTVPGRIAVRETATRIFGRGACDAKGQIVTQLWALDTAIAHGLADYACMFVVGEEVDCAGALAAVRHEHMGSRYLINGEPTGNKFVRRSWGTIEFGIRAEGTARHTCVTPVDSAAHKVVRDVCRVLGVCDAGWLVNVGELVGGSGSSVSAKGAGAEFAVRFEGAADEVKAKIGECVKESRVEVQWYVPPCEYFVPEQYRGKSTVVKFSTDAGHYDKKFDEVMLFGPGSIEHAHAEDEQVGKREMREAVEVLTDLLLSL